MSIPVARLNHAVLFVRDATASAEFYGRVFGFEVVANEFGGKAVFMRAAGGDNHHDLGLFSVGPDAPRAPRGSVGLYHLAWEVPTIEDLADASRIPQPKNGALRDALRPRRAGKIALRVRPGRQRVRRSCRVPAAKRGAITRAQRDNAAWHRCRGARVGAPGRGQLGQADWRVTMAGLSTRARDRLRGNSFAYIDRAATPSA